jgi:lipopolysaccharide transport system permease protein
MAVSEKQMLEPITPTGAEADQRARTEPRQVHVIQAGKTVGSRVLELWQYRELLYFLAWREVKLRYRQTVLGALWAILQPLITMAIFALLFGRLAGLERRTGDTPYPLYVFIGLAPWTFFANALTNSSTSLIGNVNLVTKVYFPRLIIPMAAVGAGLVDLAISLFVLVVLAAVYGVIPSLSMLVVPVLIVGVALTAAGVGALFAAMTVAYRDVRYALPFAIQCWLFVTPVIYPSSIVPEQWRWVWFMNPMAGFIDALRAAFLGKPLPWAELGMATLTAAFLFAIGAIYFRRVERSFADII